MIDLASIFWVFVCQEGSLERESCVLAASMRSVLGKDAKLTAAIPQPESAMGRPSADTLDFLSSLGVDCVPFVNPLIDTASSPRHSRLLMNKAYALQIDRDAPVVVFLDSDQICHSEFDTSNVAAPLVARRAFYPGAKATDGIWQRAYDLCHTDMPKQRIVARSRSPEDPVIVCPPYFNSGFIAVHRPWVDELIENFITCFQTISQHELLGRDRYFEEQMALAIAIMKTGVPYEIDNHRIDMSLLHYYSIPRLASLDKHRRRVIELSQRYPKLKEMLMADEPWRKLLDERFGVNAR